MLDIAVDNVSDTWLIDCDIYMKQRALDGSRLQHIDDEDSNENIRWLSR